MKKHVAILMLLCTTVAFADVKHLPEAPVSAAPQSPDATADNNGYVSSPSGAGVYTTQNANGGTNTTYTTGTTQPYRLDTNSGSNANSVQPIIQPDMRGQSGDNTETKNKK